MIRENLLAIKMLNNKDINSECPALKDNMMIKEKYKPKMIKISPPMKILKLNLKKIRQDLVRKISTRLEISKLRKKKAVLKRKRLMNLIWMVLRI